jgi:peptide subunit release factor 1 (eRF1)
MEESKKLELERLIEELGKYRGRHTELITVYVPADANLINTSKQIETEKSTAINIKSKNNRKNVLDALERITRHLRLYKETPKNGLAIFCGNISDTEGQPDIKLWAVEPPQPIKVKMYRCDQTFVLDPLSEILEVKEVFGLVVMDRKEATLGVLEGKTIRKLKHMTSGVPGKQRAGGQCLFLDTLIQLNNGSLIKIDECDCNMPLMSADFANNSFFASHLIDKWRVKKEGFKVRTKNGSITASSDHVFFVNEDNVKNKPLAQLKVGDELFIKKNNKISSTNIIGIEKLGKMEMIDISVENKNFVANGFIVHNSAQRFERLTEQMAVEFYRRVTESMKKQFFDMPKLKGILVGGPGPTKESMIEHGQLVTALKNKIIAIKDIGYTDEFGLRMLVEASQDILAKEEITKEKDEMKQFFTLLATKPEKVAYGEEEVKRALRLGAVEKLFLSKKVKRDLMDELEKMARDTGSEIVLISVETDEGKQFYNLSGIGAILRYAIGDQ